MKLLKLTFGLILPLMAMASCSQEQKGVAPDKEQSSNPKKSKQNLDAQTSEATEAYLTFEEVRGDLMDAGAIEVPEPAGFTPSFTGFDSVKHYSYPNNNRMHHVYIFSGPSDPDYDDARAICPLDWGSTGLCGNSGDDCRFEDEDGDGEHDDIVCC